ncbi:hypothetical protein EDD18DRAFT_1103658 [Armillaria luteobubalina]|uniref:Heterokaryon incompatibility domain-containing protein n=1 Tax=Armillaria luteobubalina TaxID=153913 RepID=A0AA39QCY7_9AGAR|nr:hypothetical protein EDD18DRAFT_1103658 [Armillaria luteobubalina]
MYHKPNLPELTLSALGETGHAELTIPVLKQRSYTGNAPVISSALADMPCADLGMDGVLEKLNVTLRHIQFLNHTFHEMTDFGMVYAHLRPYWYKYDIAKIEDALRTAEECDRKMWREVLVNDRITTWCVRPRRMWDLFANRVVPDWIVCEARQVGIMLIGNIACMGGQDRVHVYAMTPINGYEWPVPVPKDANLDHIHIEMLNNRVEHAWLDVLCLQQEGGISEHLRLEEWKLDVPTIGEVYASPASVPLHLTPDYFESDQCWFRRVWTLQEITEDAIIGGETGDDIMETWRVILELASEMQNWVFSTLLDKVSGLSYLLNGLSIPIYDAKKSDADAWEELMDVMLNVCRGKLFFYFPEPGNGKKYW